MRKAFVIAPIRGISEVYRDGITAQVQFIEHDFEVYWPERDTDQRPISGLPECRENLAAMKRADVVFVIWDGRSEGVIFDLGMAFALGKHIQLVTGYIPPMTKTKSIQNMLHAWAWES